MDTLNATTLAINASLNATSTLTHSFEGLIISSLSLFLMAILPIYFGAFRSLEHQIQQKESGMPVEVLSAKDATMFPIYASAALFGLYLIFNIFSLKYLNILVSLYFSAIGVVTLFRWLAPSFRALIPSSFQNSCYQFTITEKPSSNTEENSLERFTVDLERRDICCLLVSVVIALWYMITQHWIASNFFGIALSITALEMLQLNRFVNGCILFAGLFIYDIFWVFGTDVMVFVAKSFEAPIKVVFPRDFLTNGIFAKEMAMLGLGDIVIPGIFVAMLLRFDKSLKRNGSKFYFFTGYAAYICGLLVTFVVMHTFKRAQPALLYLVPACLGAPLLMATFRGDFQAMFSYSDVQEHVVDKPSPEATTVSNEIKKEK